MKTHLLLLVILLLTSCAHPRYPKPVPVSDGLPQTPDTGTLDAIRYPGQYRAYYLGRRIDPSDPNGMHESHPIYIREAPERWNLHPVKIDTNMLPLTNAPPTNAAYSPLPIADELKRELNDQRRATQQLLDNAANLERSAEQFGPAAKAFQDLNQQAQRRSQAFDERLRILEETLRTKSNLTNPAPARIEGPPILRH